MRSATSPCACPSASARAFRSVAPTCCECSRMQSYFCLCGPSLCFFHRIAALELDAAIIFAPVGALVPAALAAVKKGGRVVCGGIHMSDIPSFPYRLLWQERQLVSVANLTRKDGHEFLGIAPRAGIKMQVTRYPLAQANTALNDLRAGRFEGAAVLIP